ncbi:Protein involved in DNA repair [Trachipleistophora hominis]|uniref:Protein involved in DNA repair n=1 Tax=Trachipleistophora hominis TaxID=72359 RepID=L7K043_TRAHO|nr:Protein involved in DNA repair [Trachipleistophora hominis]
MNELLEERERIINKILKYMTENNYMDEDLFLSIKIQTLVKNRPWANEFNLVQLKKEVKESKEYKDLFDIDTILVQNIKISDICCLTQMKIRERWEGVCGHAMERSAVLNYMKKNKSARCPVVGCNMLLKEKRNEQ